MTQTCATCRFWREEGNGHLGPCLRYPPAADVQCTGRWPTTHRSNWCGEHQPREPEPEQPKERKPRWYWVKHYLCTDWVPAMQLKSGKWIVALCGIDGDQPASAIEAIGHRLEPPV